MIVTEKGAVAGQKLKEKERVRFFTSLFVSPRTGCWIWFRTTDRDGYAMFFLQGKYRYAHRLSHLLFVGSIGAGDHVCHRCDRPQCVNPDHLFLGTAKENAADRVRKGRQWSNAGRHYTYTKLKLGDVAAVRNGGGSHGEEAARLNVSPSHIYRIRRGLRWAGAR